MDESKVEEVCLEVNVPRLVMQLFYEEISKLNGEAEKLLASYRHTTGCDSCREVWRNELSLLNKTSLGFENNFANNVNYLGRV